MLHNNTTNVSVLLPVYNDASYIRSAIDSILTQTVNDFELIVINDGSTDDSLKILQSYSDPRIRIISFAKNMGRSCARNAALGAAQGKYALWMDGDDISHPQRIEKQVAFLEAHPEIDICGCALQCFHERKDIVRYPHAPKQIRAGIIWDPTIPNAASCMRLSSIRKAQLRYRENQSRAEDYTFWIDALLGSNLQAVNISDVLYQWRYFNRPTNIAYHALAARHALAYIDLPHDLHHATLHTVLSCTSDEGLEAVDAPDIVQWANDVYQAVLHSNLVSLQDFLNVTHGKIEKYLSWQPLSGSLFRQYCSSPLGRTHSLGRLCAMVAARKTRRGILG